MDMTANVAPAPDRERQYLLEDVAPVEIPELVVPAMLPRALEVVMGRFQGALERGEEAHARMGDTRPETGATLTDPDVENVIPTFNLYPGGETAPYKHISTFARYQVRPDESRRLELDVYDERDRIYWERYGFTVAPNGQISVEYNQRWSTSGAIPRRYEYVLEPGAANWKQVNARAPSETPVEDGRLRLIGQRPEGDPRVLWRINHYLHRAAEGPFHTIVVNPNWQPEAPALAETPAATGWKARFAWLARLVNL